RCPAFTAKAQRAQRNPRRRFLSKRRRTFGKDSRGRQCPVETARRAVSTARRFPRKTFGAPSRASSGMRRRIANRAKRSAIHLRSANPVKYVRRGGTYAPSGRSIIAARDLFCFLKLGRVGLV